MQPSVPGNGNESSGFKTLEQIVSQAELKHYALLDTRQGWRIREGEETAALLTELSPKMIWWTEWLAQEPSRPRTDCGASFLNKCTFRMHAWVCANTTRRTWIGECLSFWDTATSV